MLWYCGSYLSVKVHCFIVRASILLVTVECTGYREGNADTVGLLLKTMQEVRKSGNEVTVTTPEIMK